MSFQGDAERRGQDARATAGETPALPLLVAILGPTGSGKTALSLALAEGFNGEIVNCDSVALYREMEVGTAKPTATERARAPHHLLDIANLDEDVTAGDYARRARAVLTEIRGRGRLPIIVGGTGLYLRALLDGLFAGPPRSEDLRERLRERATEHGSAYLHRILKRFDAAAAANIHPNDAPKLIRAIEVCLASKAQMSELWKRGRDPLAGFRILRLGLDPDRNALYTRINERAQQMYDHGLIEETRRLRDKYGDAARPLASLGYKQAMQLLRGEIDLKRAIWTTQQAHRNYAKRQVTWFRREPDVHWLHGFGNEPEIRNQATSAVERMHTADLRG
jgi:tRNA dimethylallyltransferase